MFFNVYLFLRETETEYEWVRGRERGTHRLRSRLQALSCQHRVPRRARTHELWDHDLSRSRTLNRLSHPGAPVDLSLKKKSIHFILTRKSHRNEVVVSHKRETPLWCWFPITALRNYHDPSDLHSAHLLSVVLQFRSSRWVPASTMQVGVSLGSFLEPGGGGGVCFIVFSLF